MIHEPFFRDKKILVIDQSSKTTDDRTWCFWEKKAGIFEPIIHHQWNKLNFFSDRYTDTWNILPYQYKMIRGIDLYTFVKNESAKQANIEWLYEKIKHIQNNSDHAIVELETTSVTCDFIFNSILFKEPKAPKGKYFLLQHFKGWVIETNEPCFKPAIATFMDFNVSQQHGTTFFYVMPTSANTALIEYTLFTEELLQKQEYESALQEYISNQLNIQEFTITHEEFGVIPMTNMHFPLHDGRIINMGIAGGQAKGSSGYAFQFIQKRTEQLIQSLLKHGHPYVKRTFNDRKFHLYDSVLLNVLHNRKINGDEIFARIFQNNPAERVLQFLDNETGIMDDVKIMRSVPAGIFLIAALQELLKPIKK
jgi:lycopene beta-cyclase